MAAGLALVPLVGLGLSSASELRPIGKKSAILPIPDKKEAGCHGTSVDFVDTPREAAALAEKQGKLVFVLHVSGNFEDPRFT